MKKFQLLLSAVALLAPLPALAQTTPADSAAQSDGSDEIVIADARRTDIVVVASGIEQWPEETGRAVTLIERDAIERQQTVALADLLALTPGVTVSRNGGMGGFTGVRIRGAEAEQTLVLIDGVRVNDPSSPGGGFDFANLLAGSVKHVEVLRGPNAVVWGSQAIGGVVNLVTESGEWGTEARGNLEYGGPGSVSANAAISTDGAVVRGSLTGGYYRTDGISAAANGTEADGYRQYGATGRLKVAASDAVSFELRGYYADSRAELDGFPPPTFALADDGEYSTARELYGYAGVNAALFDDAFHNRLAFTVADIHRDNFDPAAGAAPIFFGRGRSERYEYQGNAQPAGWIKAVFGVEHEDSRFTDGSTPASTGVTSGYGELIVTPVEMLTINGGVRHDDHRDYGGHTSFGISAALHPRSGTRLHASYGDGFKAPTLYQLFSFFGTPTLRPETAVSYEVGGEQWIGNVGLGATWFHRDTHNQIDFDLGTFTYGNIDRARAEGVELTLRARPTSRLEIGGSFTHVVSENRSPGANLGKDLARRPRDAGNISVDYGVLQGPSFGATLLVVGDSFDDAGNFTRLKGYALASVRAEVPLTRQISLYGRVENLLDRKYQTVAGYGTPGRAAYGGVRVKLD